MNLVKATATIGGLTLVSRIAGFVRDMLMAAFVGAGMAADAFLIAFRLPNLFRALFAEGAFSAAFVPMFNRQMGADGGDMNAAKRFAEDVLAVLLPVLVIFTLLMVIAAGPVVWALTGGFPDAEPQKFALTVDYTRLTFPYLMLISLVAGMIALLATRRSRTTTPVELSPEMMARLMTRDAGWASRLVVTRAPFLSVVP